MILMIMKQRFKNITNLPINILKHYHIIIGIGFILFSVTSCNLFGLPLQEDYVYNANIPDPNLHTTVMEFIESRKDKNMTLMYDAIQYLGIADEYEKDNRTFILMSNTCFIKFLDQYKVTSVEDMDKTELKNLLFGQIGIGLYNSYNLTTTPVEIETVNPLVVFYLNLRPASISDPDKYSIRINNVPQSSKYTSISTSNLVATNGYIHIIDYTYTILYKQ